VIAHAAARDEIIQHSDFIKRVLQTSLTGLTLQPFLPFVMQKMVDSNQAIGFKTERPAGFDGGPGERGFV
jgi:hypothetical protein